MIDYHSHVNKASSACPPTQCKQDVIVLALPHYVNKACSAYLPFVPMETRHVVFAHHSHVNKACSDC